MWVFLLGGSIAFLFILYASLKYYVVHKLLPASVHGHQEKKKSSLGPIDNAISKQGFASKKIPQNLDAIIIGSGMSGLTTAACMAKAGKRVLVLEQHDVAGGNTHTFEEKGFEFDTGLHYVGGKLDQQFSPTRKIFDYITDNGVEWERLDDVVDRVVITNEQGSNKRYEVSVVSSLDRYQENLFQKFPQEKQSIIKYFKLAKFLRTVIALYFMCKLLPRPLTKLVYALNRKKFAYLNQTTLEVLSKLTSNKELIGVLAYAWGDYGSSPGTGSFVMNILLLDHYCNGGSFYPVGGPAEIAKHVIHVIESNNGGKVLVRAPVSCILINDQNTAYGVVVKNIEIFAPVVISTVGTPITYTKLVPEQHRSQLEQATELVNDTNVKPECSLMTLFVGLDDEKDELDLPNNNLWVFPTCDHDANIVKSKSNVDAPLAATFISFPSSKDSSYQSRHAGKKVAIVIGAAFYDQVKEFKDERIKHRGDKYNALKAKWEKILLKTFLAEFPQCKGKISFLTLGTPLTNDFYLGTLNGAIYGLGHTPARFQSIEALRPQTKIKNLYLSGQDVLTCGIAGAAFGGILTTTAISPLALAQFALRYWRDFVVDYFD